MYIKKNGRKCLDREKYKNLLFQVHKENIIFIFLANPSKSKVLFIK